MRKLSETHPDPRRALYTIFTVDDISLENVKYYQKVTKDPSNPNSEDLYILFDERQTVVGFQSPNKPKVLDTTQTQKAVFKIDDVPSATIWKLDLPPSLPLFPPLKKLINLLKSEN